MSEELPEQHGLRAADKDREAAVAALQHHAEAGRLDYEELSLRVGRALSAKTLGELHDLTRDLPAPVAAAPPDRLSRRPITLVAGKFAVFNAIVIALWLMGGHHDGFWPGWVMLLSALVFTYRVLNGQLRQVRRRERERRRSA